MWKAELPARGDAHWSSLNCAHARNATPRIEWRPDMLTMFRRNLKVLPHRYAGSRCQISITLHELLLLETRNLDPRAFDPVPSVLRIGRSRQAQILRS